MFEFELSEHIATLGTSGDYTTELNRVSFNGHPAKLDLRKWKAGKPLKGISLTDDEAYSLLQALKGVLGE